MLAPVTHILPLTTIRRERFLPTPGRIVVRQDQKVKPLDVVAEANLGQGHIILDVSRILGVDIEDANELIQCKVGDRVEKKQILAQRPGFVTQVVRAPQDAKVVALGGGQVLLEIGEGIFELHAGIPGTITRVISDRGVEITVDGALVQGVWGNGRVDLGIMINLLASPDAVLSTQLLDINLRGSVILAGHCADQDTLTTLNDLPVRGLILGSISPALLSTAMQMRFPVVVIDGFGQRNMNAIAFKLLTTNAKREVSLNAETYDRQTGIRPEIIIPLPVSQKPSAPRDVVSFTPGQQVRLCCNPHASEVGTLVNLKPGLILLPSGLRMPAGDVQLESGTQVVVPLVNLEVIG